MSFSQALEFLEQRGVTVEHLGRVQRFDCLMWRVDGQELDKDGVVAYAQQLAQEGSSGSESN